MYPESHRMVQLSREFVDDLPKHQSCRALLEDILARLHKTDPWTEWAIFVSWSIGRFYRSESRIFTCTEKTG